MRAEVGKNLTFDRFVLARAFDDEIGGFKSVKRHSRTNAVKCGISLCLRDPTRRDLPSHIAIDGCKACFDTFARDVMQQHVIACQRTDMSDAVAHLPCTDNANLANIHLSSPTSSGIHVPLTLH